MVGDFYPPQWSFISPPFILFCNFVHRTVLRNRKDDLFFFGGGGHLPCPRGPWSYNPLTTWEALGCVIACSKQPSSLFFPPLSWLSIPGTSYVCTTWLHFLKRWWPILVSCRSELIYLLSYHVSVRLSSKVAVGLGPAPPLEMMSLSLLKTMSLTHFLQTFRDDWSEVLIYFVHFAWFKIAAVKQVCFFSSQQSYHSFLTILRDCVHVAKHQPNWGEKKLSLSHHCKLLHELYNPTAI